MNKKKKAEPINQPLLVIAYQKHFTWSLQPVK